MRGHTIAAILAAAPAFAEAPELGLPLDCDPGAGCFIQRYVDRDPGPGAVDFACGPLVSDGHGGVDFALPSLRAMRDGVDVVSSFPGTVRNVRDGMPDIPVDDPDAPELDGRDCGNGVVIAHGDGWETQYCHLMRGSISVAPGDKIDGGIPLGRVGLSGNTSFPHVHFTVRHDGATVDPFAPDGSAECGDGTGLSMWDQPIPYRAGGLIASGFFDRIPEYDEIKDGSANRTRLEANAPALVVWGYVFGGQARDILGFTVEGPGGEILSQRVTLDRSQPQLFRAVGRRTPPDGWPAGRYGGSITLERDGQALDTQDVTVTIGD